MVPGRWRGRSSKPVTKPRPSFREGLEAKIADPYCCTAGAEKRRARCFLSSRKDKRSRGGTLGALRGEVANREKSDRAGAVRSPVTEPLLFEHDDLRRGWLHRRLIIRLLRETGEPVELPAHLNDEKQARSFRSDTSQGLRRGDQRHVEAAGVRIRIFIKERCAGIKL